MYYITSYVKGMAGWIIITFLIEYVFFFAQKHKRPNKKILLKMLLTAYLIGVFSQTIFPNIHFEILGDTGRPHFHIYLTQWNQSGINLCPFKTIIEQFSGTNASINASDLLINGILNLLGNIGLFIPIGFMLSAISGSFRRMGKSLTTCAAISIFIEIVQLFIGRSMDIDDVLLNLLGAFIGNMIWRLAGAADFRRLLAQHKK